MSKKMILLMLLTGTSLNIFSGDGSGPRKRSRPETTSSSVTDSSPYTPRFIDAATQSRVTAICHDYVKFTAKLYKHTEPTPEMLAHFTAQAFWKTKTNRLFCHTVPFEVVKELCTITNLYYRDAENIMSTPDSDTASKYSRSDD